MDVRKAQDPKRGFGTAPTAAWSAFRQRVPLGQGAARGIRNQPRTRPLNS